jgi:hypothetical protein
MAMNTETEKYNGWANYETWRIALEIFDSWTNEPMNPESCKEFAEFLAIDAIPELEGTLAEGYIRSFLERVDWREISESTYPESLNH